MSAAVEEASKTSEKQDVVTSKPKVSDDANDKYEATRKQIEENASFSKSYVVMNTLATIVACYGLLQDSTAVVIGAMIIAMLLGPITGIALALVDGNSTLLRKALLAEIGGATLVLSVAFLLGTVHREMPLTKEILARTSPNILDLMIALAGGAAGAYATVSPRISVGLVGVAIATALVPPLSTCAICVARGEVRLAFGGFLLFFANFVAIQFASSVVMWLSGYHRVTNHPGDGHVVYGRNAVSFVVLLILAVYLGFSFSKSIERQRHQAQVRENLEAAFKAFPGVRLTEVRFQQATDKEVIFAVIVTPYSFSPERVAAIEDKLPTPTTARLELHIRSIITKETTRTGYQHELPAPSTTESDEDKIGQ